MKKWDRDNYKARFNGILIGGALCLISLPVSAADLSMKDAPDAGDKFELTGYGQLTSDYIFRGISQNRRDPAMQGGLDATYGMFYAGTFLSKVDFAGIGGTNTHVEADLYAGIHPKWHDLTFDFGVITYNYPRSANFNGTTRFDPFYYEIKAGVSGTILKDVAWSTTLYYSPDTQFDAGAATTFEGSLTKPLFKKGDLDFSGSGTFGAVWYDKTNPTVGVQADYRYWNLGITTTYKEKISFDVRWWDTDATKGIGPCGVGVFECGSTVVGTAKVAF